jgi:hypothetical protein
MQTLLFPDLTEMYGKVEFIADEVQYISGLFPSAKSDSGKAKLSWAKFRARI